MIDDASIDSRPIEHRGETLALEAALARWTKEQPSLAGLQRAARLYADCSPAMLESCARWLDIGDRLRAAGLSSQDILHTYARACVGAYACHPPDEPVIEQAVASAAPAVLEGLCDSLAARGKLDPYRDGMLAAVALETIARAGAPPERFDALLSFYRSPSLVRPILEAMPEARRQARLGELLEDPFNAQNGRWRVQRILPFTDLLGEPQKARLRARVDPLRWDDDRQSQALVKSYDAGHGSPADPVRGEDGFTDSTRSALGYWTEKLAKERMRQGLGPLAEERAAVAIEVSAPELAELDAWRAATDARREAIARAVEAAAAPFALRYLEIVRTRDLPIATFAHEPTGARLCLVPGGELVRGFSEREEAIVRKASADHAGMGNHYEEYDYLLEQAATMRPVAKVRVGPFLLFQQPSEPREPAEVTVMLEELPFRLPTEAEHEHAERGGRTSELTWDGDAIPDEAWMARTRSELRLNGFGLALFGHYPEACADVWHPSYEGAPADGSARLGDGPRVARGGAMMISPWQACGEWQLLTNAVRGSTTAWEFFLSIRPALGIRLV